jgi:2-iminobutanoate/2-iminopropanoate deaminase
MPDYPKPIGPYRVAVVANGFIFTAGQIPVDPENGEVESDDIAIQTERAITNLQAVLVSHGSDLSNVIKTTVFLADMNHFAAMNEVYGRHFTEPHPARSAVQVARLPKDVLVEIEAVATVA